MLSPAANALADALVTLFCAPGSAYAHDDPALHRPRLAFELETGQWLAVTRGAEPLAWASWYRVDDEVLAALQRGEHDGWVREQRYPVLTSGPHCYIASIIVVPGAPRGVYRTVIGLVGACNEDATSLSGSIVRPDGSERFVVRENRGGPDWWRARQNDAHRVH